MSKAQVTRSGRVVKKVKRFDEESPRKQTEPSKKHVHVDLSLHEVILLDGPLEPPYCITDEKFQKLLDKDRDNPKRGTKRKLYTAPKLNSATEELEPDLEFELESFCSSLRPYESSLSSSGFEDDLDISSESPPGYIHGNGWTLSLTPKHKHSFLKSLQGGDKLFSHPDSLKYQRNYVNLKGQLANIICTLYNRKLFHGDLNVPLSWSNKIEVAAICQHEKRKDKRYSKIVLNSTLLTEPMALHVALVHQLCHAANWTFNGKCGHDLSFHKWCTQARRICSDIPHIDDCSYQYTYRCVLCDAKAFGHQYFDKRLLCAYCCGPIEIVRNLKFNFSTQSSESANLAREYISYVKRKYEVYRQDGFLPHSEVMSLLLDEYKLFT